MLRLIFIQIQRELMKLRYLELICVNLFSSVDKPFRIIALPRIRQFQIWSKEQKIYFTDFVLEYVIHYLTHLHFTRFQ